VERLKEEFMIEEDSALMALRQYQNAKDDLLSYVASSSHVRRLQRLGIQKDIAYCLQHDLYDVLPVLRGNALVNM
jgi:2-phosphosulfolactate phosphatase